jgi:hypothetical protein
MCVLGHKASTLEIQDECIVGVNQFIGVPVLDRYDEYSIAVNIEEYHDVIVASHLTMGTFPYD